MELRHLRYFIAVAEELHFGRAALRLHLSQPPLSQQIRQLEEILGHALFTRTSRAVKLTSAGEVFLERARRIMRSVEQDMEEARSVGRGEEGFLRVGFIGSAMLTPLPAMLGRYRRLYPKVNLQLHVPALDARADGFTQCRLDAIKLERHVEMHVQSAMVDGFNREGQFAERRGARDPRETSHAADGHQVRFTIMTSGSACGAGR